VRTSLAAVLGLSLLSATGCAALTGLSSLDECSDGTCGDASVVDSHVADLGVDTNVAPDVTDAQDSASEAADTADASDTHDSATEAGDARDAADADTPVDTLDTAPDTFDAAPCTLACDTTHSLGGSCVGGKCVYTGCKSGFGDCDTTGTDINGCETSITTVSDCGGCGNICDTATSTPTACAGGVCAYTCKTGFADCDVGSSSDPHDLNGCETPTTTTAHCGGCGGCDKTESIGAACSTGSTTKCTYSGCSAGFKDCNATAAPDTDGCETPITTVTDCGDCGKACDTVKSTPTSCTSGTCNYSCKTGFIDCNMAGGDLDGCECAGTACCGTGTTCQLAHSDGPSGTLGLGQTYFDCHALGTPGVASSYTEPMAREAALASPWAVSPTDTTCTDIVGGTTCIAGTSSHCVIAGRTADPTGPECAIWCYDGVLAGRVFTSTTGCFCPCPGGDTWN
jgi:hypothetical protein